MKNNFREVPAAHGLERLGDVLETSMKPKLQLGTRNPSEAPISRLGGRPNLPEEFEWPLWSYDNPLAFLVQLQLDDIPPLDGLDLPRTGSLFFFHDAGQCDWEGVAVLYSEAALTQSPLREFPDELADAYRFRPLELIEMGVSPCFPGQTDQLIAEQQLTDEELRRYRQCNVYWGLQFRRTVLAATPTVSSTRTRSCTRTSDQSDSTATSHPPSGARQRSLAPAQRTGNYCCNWNARRMPV
jgi:hypothetical protein